MEFDRCAGCPGGECLTKQFAGAIVRGEIDPKDLHRGRAPGEYNTLFIQWINENGIELTCSGVACGMGDRATIAI